MIRRFLHSPVTVSRFEQLWNWVGFTLISWYVIVHFASDSPIGWLIAIVILSIWVMNTFGGIVEFWEWLSWDAVERDNEIAFNLHWRDDYIQKARRVKDETSIESDQVRNHVVSDFADFARSLNAKALALRIERGDFKKGGIRQFIHWFIG